MLLGWLHTHLDQLLQGTRQANTTQKSRLEGAAAKQHVLTEYLEVVVLLHMSAQLAIGVAEASTRVEAAVLVAAALGTAGDALVQLTLDIHVLGALVLKSPVGRETEAIHLHLAHAQRLRLHLLQPKYVLHDIERVLQTLLAVRSARGLKKRCMRCMTISSHTYRYCIMLGLACTISRPSVA